VPATEPAVKLGEQIHGRPETVNVRYPDADSTAGRVICPTARID
jgi:hypothetical protein